MKRNMSVSACAMVALAGSSMSALGNDWAAAVDGNWNDAINWVGSDVPNVIGDDAVLGLSGAYTVSVTNNFTHGALAITNTDATLALGSIFHTLNGDLLNNGTVVINKDAVVFNSHIAFGADAMIAGNGEIVLNGIGSPGDAQVISNTGFTVTHASGHTIRGAGLLAGTMINNGNIIGDSVTGGLELQGTLTQGAGGNAGADGGTLQLGSGSVTSGGEFITSNGGVVHTPSGTATIGDITNSGDMTIAGSGTFLALNGDVINNGTITINSNLVVFNGHLRFDTAAALNGTGSVIMQTLGSTDDAIIYTGGAFGGTIGADQTVQGAGRIEGSNGGTIVNNGTINGNDASGFELQLLGSHSGNGVYRSDNGLLGLGNGLFLDGGTFDSSGTGIVDMISNGISTLSNVTNLGQMGVRGNGGSITLAGPMTNNGTLTLNTTEQVFNAHLRFGATTSLTGTGTVQMVSVGALDDAQVFTDGLFTGTIGAGQTIAGSGQVDGRFDGTIVNNGTINGNHAAAGKDPAIQLQLRGNHDGSGGGVYRSDDGILGLSNGLVLDGGTFDSSGVGIVDMTTNGIATLSNVTNIGEMGIRGDGGSITLVGPMTNDGNLTINSNDNIFNAHLRFGAATTLDGSGTVTMKIQGDSGDAQIFTDGVFTGTIGADQTIQGAGQVDGRSGGTIVNNGTINGNDPSFELELRGNHTGSGVYRSDDGVLAMIGGASLDGGSFESSGVGIVDMTSNGIVTLSNITNAGEMGIRGNGGIVELPTNLTNNGNISINSNDNIFNAHIRFVSDSAINGTGTVVMAVQVSFDDAQIIADTGFTGTIGSGQSLSGDGLLVGMINLNGEIDPGGLTREIRVDILTLSSTSGMVADLGGLLAGEFDRLTLGGSDTIALDGTLTVNLDGGYVPAFGDTWDIIDGGAVSGEFATENMPAAPLGQVYRVIYEADRVYVVLTCDADLTGDNILDFFDVSIFLNYFGAGDVRADINGDGFFDFFDVSLFLQLFGGGCS